MSFRYPSATPAWPTPNELFLPLKRTGLPALISLSTVAEL